MSHPSPPPPAWYEPGPPSSREPWPPSASLPGERRGGGPWVVVGALSLGAGVVALGLSWVPWVNLLALVVALGALVGGALSVVRGRGVGRGLGIGGAAVSVVALAVVVVLLGVSAVGLVRDRARSSTASAPSAAPGAPPAPSPARPSRPSATPAPSASPASPRADLDDAAPAAQGSPVELEGYSGTLDDATLNATWTSSRSARDGAAPRSASVVYDLTMTNDGTATADAETDVESGVYDAAGTRHQGGACEADLEAAPAARALAPGQSVTLHRCADLPPGLADNPKIMVTNAAVPDSRTTLLAVEITVDDVRQLAGSGRVEG